MKSAKALRQEAYNFYEQKNYTKAYEILVKLEAQLTKKEDEYNEYYTDMGIICFYSKKYSEACKYFDKIDSGKPYSDEIYQQGTLVATHQQRLVLSVVIVFRNKVHMQQQSKNNNDENDGNDDDDDDDEDAEDNYQQEYSNPDVFYTNIAYCYSQLKAYKQAKNFVDRAVRNGENNIQLLLTKSDVYCYFNKPKIAAEALHKAFINYKTNNIKDTDFSPQEMKFIHNKLGGQQNEQNIKQLYEYMSKNKIEGKQLQVAQQFMSELTDKKITSISQEVQDQIRALFPESLLNNMKAEKDLEPLMKDKAIADYYHAFLLEADGSYFQALGLSKGFQQSSNDIRVLKENLCNSSQIVQIPAQ